jgi:hypothetical protein
LEQTDIPEENEKAKLLLHHSHAHCISLVGESVAKVAKHGCSSKKFALSEVPEKQQ